MDLSSERNTVYMVRSDRWLGDHTDMDGSMPNEQVTALANHIFDDLHRSTYYADPKILGDLVERQ